MNDVNGFKQKNPPIIYTKLLHPRNWSFMCKRSILDGDNKEIQSGRSCGFCYEGRGIVYNNWDINVEVLFENISCIN